MTTTTFMDPVTGKVISFNANDSGRTPIGTKQPRSVVEKRAAAIMANKKKTAKKCKGCPKVMYLTDRVLATNKQKFHSAACRKAHESENRAWTKLTCKNCGKKHERENWELTRQPSLYDFCGLACRKEHSPPMHIRGAKGTITILCDHKDCDTLFEVLPYEAKNQQHGRRTFCSRNCGRQSRRQPK